MQEDIEAFMWTEVVQIFSFYFDEAYEYFSEMLDNIEMCR